MNGPEIESLRAEIAALSPAETLRWAAEHFGDEAALASSLGAEDQVLLDMAQKAGLLAGPHALRPFTLDTGRLFPETLDLLDASESRYGVKFDVFYPETSAVEAMVAEGGINLFRKSVEARHRCCSVRKVEPLRRALAGKKLWIVGLRADQNANRSGVQRLTWDEPNGLLKLSPIIDWTLDQVMAYLEENQVPRNALHARGFPSIGCAPCTRAIEPGEDERAGRWWWEQESQKECGLHLVNGRLVRSRS